MKSAEHFSNSLFSASGSRELDSIAINRHGISGYELMNRAARSAYHVCLASWPRARQVSIVCGRGNNGGDGYVVGRLFLQGGRNCQVIALGKPKTEDARQAESDYIAAGGEITPFETPLPDAGLVIDGLLGTGIEREVSGDYLAAIEAMNASLAPVLALDIPSGLHSDRGIPMPAAVRADATVTFIGKKLGLYTGPAVGFTGEVHYADLGVPEEVYANVPPMARVISPSALEREPDSHKGSCGRVLVLGGSIGMGGAATMAGMAALRCGAGLVRVATHPEHARTIGSNWPELMVEGVDDLQAARHWIGQASVLVLGPGLGQTEWSSLVCAAAAEADLPCVLDADALRFLVSDDAKNPDRVLTPHPGEAAGLLASSTAEVHADRYSAVNRLYEKFGGAVVLKGAGTLVTSEDGTWLCDRGNPGMATAGMGDVLSGVIGGLLGQGLSTSEAARTGVWIHSAAGDYAAAEVTETGLVSTDLLPWIPLFAEADPDDC